jgi:hypothetical protein
MKSDHHGKTGNDAGPVKVLYVVDTPIDVDRVHAARKGAGIFEEGVHNPDALESCLAQDGWDFLITVLGIFGLGTFGIRMDARTFPRLRSSSWPAPERQMPSKASRGAADYIRKSDIEPRCLPKLLRHLIEITGSCGQLDWRCDRHVLFDQMPMMLVVVRVDARHRHQRHLHAVDGLDRRRDRCRLRPV